MVLCFHPQGEEIDSTFKLISTQKAVEEAGGMGVIIAKNPTRTMDEFISEFPVITVSFDAAIHILNYIRSSKNPRAQLSPSRTHVGRPITTRIASFSSRGPNSFAPAILKVLPLKNKKKNL